MKKLIIIVFSAIVLFNLSCLPDKCCHPPQPSSAMTAEKNGEPWTTRYVKGTISDLDTITISALNIETMTDTIRKLDSLNIRIRYNGKGSYDLHANQVFYATFTKSSVNSFKIDTSFNNRLNITNYQIFENSGPSPNQIKITGTFIIKFIDPTNPVGISFLNGNFYTIMNQ